MIDVLDRLPHQPPMRLVEEVLELAGGSSARTVRLTRDDDWFFQGHFPGQPVVPAVVLIELIAQTGGLAAATPPSGDSAGTRQLRIAAVGPFRFPDAAGVGDRLEISARVVGRLGGLVKIEGDVRVGGRVVASGSVTLAEPRQAADA